MIGLEQVLRTAFVYSDSVPCPYPDAQNPANWVLYSGRNEDIPDGEVVLVKRESAAGSRAFRRCDQKQQVFIRKSGGRLEFGHVDAVWRYHQAVNQTPISCPDLEGIL